MAKRGKLQSPSVLSDGLNRPIRWRRYGYLFLIVCEDQTTEPLYFRQFNTSIPAETVYLRDVGTGLDQQGVVLRAIEERNQLAEESGKDVDVVWVVFDKDDADENSTKVSNFIKAFEIAASNQIKVALSNEAFEIWLLLHLCNIDPSVAIGRAEIYKKLGEEIRKHENYTAYIYDHHSDSGKVVPIIAAIGNQEKAIERAEYLANKFKGFAPISANPSTDVYLLIRELLIIIKYFSWEP